MASSSTPITQTPITVIGAGSWGTALALVLARNDNPVHLWGNETERMIELQSTRINAYYLPGRLLPDNIDIYTDLEKSLKDVRDVFIVVPSHAFRSVLKQIKPLVANQVRIAWGTKGLDPETKQLLHHAVAEIFSKETPIAVLAGPSFADEVARDLPTAVSLAGNDAAFVRDMMKRMHHDRFRVYENSDLVGVQLCGTLKNILAIAVGIADGLGLGANTRAALITRGFAEMARLSESLGGKTKTLLSLAGMGDVVLTCTDNQSRNRRLGLAIGQGKDRETAEKEIGQAVEGVGNAKQVYELAQRLHVDMPITEQVYQVLYQGHSPQDVLNELLERAPKSE